MLAVNNVITLDVDTQVQLSSTVVEQTPLKSKNIVQTLTI